LTLRPRRRARRSPRALTATAAAIAIAAVALGAPVQPAGAAGHPSHDVVVSDNPADQTPDVLDGHVDAFAQIGTTMIVGGLFTSVSQGGVTYPRRNIFAFDVVTGEVSQSFRPKTDGEVFSLAASRDRKGVYAAGDFSSVNGRRHTVRIARIRLADGSVDAGFRSPGVNGEIRDIVYARRAYYIAGYFTRVGGHARNYVAALNAKGDDTGRVRLDFSGTIRSGRTHVRTMDIAPGGKLMVVAGNFRRVNGKRRAQLALLRTDVNGTKVAGWSTTRLRPQCGRRWDTYVRDVAFAPSGRYFAVANTGGLRGTQSSGLLCDSVSRWDVGTGRSGGQQPAWIDYTGGDSLSAVIVDSRAVYVGGHQRWLNNSYGENSEGPGAVDRPGIAALDPVNGLPYEWNPGRPRGVGVFGMAITKGGLWIGHDTEKFAGEPHQRIAFCPVAGGEAPPPNRTASLPGVLTLLGPGGKPKAVANDFDGHMVSNRRTVPSSSMWDEVRGSFVVDGILYAGWSDGTMTAQTFDGSTLGGQVTVSLHGTFGDLSQVSAMFYDRPSHRIYYTHAGSDRLYYRYFTPESRIVGAWRFTVHRKSSIAWNRVSGAFVAGKWLYYLDFPTRSLRRVAWHSGQSKAVGAVTTIAGPKRDGASYRAQGVVLTS
jgi:hypothetical protein